jgi:hypothetical protein
MERTPIKVELETIAAKRVNAKYQLDTDPEVCEIHYSCAETRQRTTADRCASDRNRSNLTRLSANPNNPAAFFLPKTKLLN